MSLNELLKQAKSAFEIKDWIAEDVEKDGDNLTTFEEWQKRIISKWVSVEALKPKLDALNELMKRQPLPEAFAWQNDFKSQYEHWTRKLKEVLGSDEKEPSQMRNVYPCGER